MAKPKLSRRVGIYSGTFDPVHIGHITFALQALKQAKLDVVYFLPERIPQSKEVQELFGHRTAMIRRAIQPHKQFKLLELNDRHFTVNRTLPKLINKFKGNQLVFIFGSDKISSLNTWPSAAKLINESEIIIGLREGVSERDMFNLTSNWSTKPIIIHSYAPSVASNKIRRALNTSQSAEGLLASVSSYIRRHWLYISIT